MVVFLILLLLPLPAIAGDLQTMRAMAEHLRTLPVRYSPSRGATPLLTAFKHQLRDWVESQLPSADKLPQDCAAFSTTLSARLKDAGLLPPRSSEERPFGYVTRLEVSRPKGYDNLLLILTGVSIPCGDDDSAYLYEWGQNRWARRFEAERNDYERDYAPQELRSVHFSGRDDHGSLLLLTIEHNPQCSSFWNVIYHRLYRIGPRLPQPVPLLDGEASIYLGNAPDYDVALEQGSLTLEFLDSSIDGAIHSRTRILRYRVQGNEVQRTAPVALRPQDFVDEWLTRRRGEMEAYSAPSERTQLREWHQRLTAGHVSGEFELVQQCQEEPRLWQIGLAMNYDEKAGRFLERRYFFVWQREDYQFQMLSVSATRQPGCPGNDGPTAKCPSLFRRARR